MTLDSVGDVGAYTSLAIDPQGDAHVGYYDATNGDLRYCRVSTSLLPVTDPPIGDRLVVGSPRPNPWSGGPIKVFFTLPAEDVVFLGLSDFAGRQIAARDPERFSRGSHTILWRLALGRPGAYFMRLRTSAGWTGAGRVVFVR